MAGTMARRGENSARIAARNRKALEMALAGATMDRIAEECGWKNKGAASKAVQKMVRDSMQVDPKQLETLRAQEVARLDRLQAAHWMNALRGDARATEMVLKISDRRSKLLGLDAPQKVEAVITEELDGEITRMLSLLPPATKG